MKTDFLCEECHQHNLLIPSWKDQDGNPSSDYDEFEAGVWYRRGKRRVNERSSYSTPGIHAGTQLDDSYNFNIIDYQNVTFSEVTLNGGAYSSINFDGRSSITIENDEKFN